MASVVDNSLRTVQAGILSWVLPGAGHFFLGQRAIALVLFLAVSLPYWTGVAIGGVMNSVNPRVNKWLFAAEMLAGGYTTTCFVASSTLQRQTASMPIEERFRRYIAIYPGSDVAQIYLATAGLLNLLVILDAMSRAQYAAPTYHRQPEPDSGAAAS